MKTLLLSLLLAGAAFSVHAQPVTASTALLEMPPALPYETSAWKTVVFTNRTASPIQVYGLGWDGPFDVDWTCSGGNRGILPAQGTCALSVRFRGGQGVPLGLIRGLVGFRLASGTVLVDLYAFTYSTFDLFGLVNLRNSLLPLGFEPQTAATLASRLRPLETLLMDARPANNRRVCGQMQFFEQQVLHEAARDRVRDWSAAVLVVQKDAIWQYLRCGGPWVNR